MFEDLKEMSDIELRCKITLIWDKYFRATMHNESINITDRIAEEHIYYEISTKNYSYDIWILPQELIVELEIFDIAAEYYRLRRYRKQCMSIEKFINYIEKCFKTSIEEKTKLEL